MSASYFLVFVLPAAQRRRDDLAAEATRERQTVECAEQARRAGHDMDKYQGIGPPFNVSSVSNHYNRRLRKCIVDVGVTDKDGFAEFVMDAYEQSRMVVCRTQVNAFPTQNSCEDSQGNNIDPDEAQKQIDALMRE
jgi:hypothetical protein